jgi:hypothetical protein
VQLKFFDVEYAIEVIDLKTHDIELHHNLIKRQVLHEFDMIFYLTHLPVFLKDQGKYFLVARHWVYAFFVGNGVFEFPALIVHDEKLLEQVFRIDESEISTIFSRGRAEGESINKPKSRKTITKHKAANSGQICPFCGGVLRKSRKNEKIDGKGYKITCENKSNKLINNGRGCDFEAVLTDIEFEKFKKYDLPTSEWLIPIENKKGCPLCHGDILFHRMIRTGQGIKNSERCRNYHSRDKKCKYNISLDTEEHDKSYPRNN